MGLKQRLVFDAGTTKNPQQYGFISNADIQDQGGLATAQPKSSYTISETSNYTFTNKIVGPTTQNIEIADGQRRPGTK